MLKTDRRLFAASVGKRKTLSGPVQILPFMHSSPESGEFHSGSSAHPQRLTVDILSIRKRAKRLACGRDGGWKPARHRIRNNKDFGAMETDAGIDSGRGASAE